MYTDWSGGGRPRFSGSLIRDSSARHVSRGRRGGEEGGWLAEKLRN